MALKDIINKRSTKIVLLVIVILAIVITAGYFLFNSGKHKEKNQNLNTEVSEGNVPRVIDGVLVQQGKENSYPIAVMIENLSTVRPQSGLDKANVVYEALAEGGITRFLAIYASEDEIKEIGPVRSARDYFLDWVSEYNALYAHCGGSPSALRLIPQYQLLDLNQIGGDHPYFWRQPERSSAPEHTLFTSSKLLTFALRDKKITKDADYEPWLFKKEAALTERPEDAKKITIDYSTFSYKVEYEYNREKNIYLRSNGGAPQLDYKTKEQLSAKNVVVQYVKTGLADNIRLTMDTIGEGGSLVFQDGQMINGTWKKESRTDRTRFYGENGEEIKFNPGQIWIEIVPTDRTVEYK